MKSIRNNNQLNEYSRQNMHKDCPSEDSLK